MDILDRGMIRHLLAAIAYRMTRAIQDVQETYPDFSTGSGVRAPVEILHHVSAMLGRALNSFESSEALDNYSHERWNEESLATWSDEVERFYEVIGKLDAALASDLEPQTLTWEQILQGPLSDVLTHIGQLTTLRRLAGNPVQKESYIRANIQIGDLRPK